MSEGSSGPVREVSVHADAAQLAAAATTLIAGVLRRSLESGASASLALSGGSTPLVTYGLLAGEDLDWDRVELFWGDERCVAPDHPESNFGQARRVLIEPAGIPARAVHRMRGELAPAAAAADYERLLHAKFSGPRPAFDLAFMGIGEDGHTASLFPGGGSAESGAALGAWVVATRAPGPPRDRVSLTYQALRGAAQTVFLVSGASKAPVVGRILSGAGGELPAARVARQASSVLWLVDRAAYDPS